MPESGKDMAKKVVESHIEKLFGAIDRYKVITPFAKNPEICVVKVMDEETRDKKLSPAHRSVNRIVLHWSLGVQLLPFFNAN